MTRARTNADNVTADIAGITAGTGITGGGTSGTVTITNDMATTIAAKGDILAGTANDAYSALTVGTNGQVLTAASGQATGLEWATPAAGGMTVIASGNLSGSSTTISSIPATYNNLQLIVRDFYTLDNASALWFRLNGNSTAGSYTECIITGGSADVNTYTTSRTFINTFLEATTDVNTYVHLNLIDYTNSMNKYFEFGSSRTVPANFGNATGFGTFINTSAISSITISNENAISVSGGSYILYGVK